MAGIGIGALYHCQQLRTADALARRLERKPPARGSRRRSEEFPREHSDLPVGRSEHDPGVGSDHLANPDPPVHDLDRPGDFTRDRAYSALLPHTALDAT